MRTLLSQFCEEFDSIVRPLLVPLRRAAECLESAPRVVGGMRADLVDLRDQFGALADKVAGQQAYVLIFGPLKSGKSTLMNALSASYVSEVTSLPAYPCMVHVSHSEKLEYVVTRYDGRTERFTDPTALHMHISRSHADLADAIRRVEEQGGEFDPKLHFAEALRRVHVKVPAGELEQSGAVLVDTPGLYSRMKFGYDRMTREFRSAAACAIFVVKSDNLFLEQVFEEFTDLLDLFSRIFLVVNLDTNKRDLRPDGSLVPSIEQEAPLRIIEAFQNLSMSAPLKAAADEGRLKIYPVDLLKAASRRLRAARGDESASLEADATSAEFQGQANFESFLSDLTEYLNSTDYLVAFLGDSIKRANALLGEVHELCDSSWVETLQEGMRDLERERNEIQRRQDATQRLEQFDWRSTFDDLEEKLGTAIQEREREVHEETCRTLDQALDAWMKEDSSLQALVDDRFVPALRNYQEQVGNYVCQLLDVRVNEGSAGIHVPLDVAADLGVAQLDLSELGQGSAKKVNRRSLLSPPQVPLTADQIPVHKTLWDWLFLRSGASVRKRLFGAADRPSIRLSPAIKQQRLGQNGRDGIRRAIDQYLGEFAPRTIQRMKNKVLKVYSQSVVGSVKKKLEERRLDLKTQQQDLVERTSTLEAVLGQITGLRSETESAQQAVADLKQRYGQTDPDLLNRPVAAEAEVVLTPAAPPRESSEPETVPERSESGLGSSGAIETESESRSLEG